MGLHVCYDLSLPADTPESDVRELVERLHARAIALPFRSVSPMVNVSPGDPIPASSWAPRDITDFLRTWAAIQSRFVNADGYHVGPRSEVAMVGAVGFVVRPGERCEAAPFGLCAPMKADDALRALGALDFHTWHWHYCCKTQYASLVSDEHLIRCHTSLLALLEDALRLGFTVGVRDQTGYWPDRDTATLLASVHEFNGIVARFAGALHDRISSVGTLHGPVIDHPEFEHLEMQKRREPGTSDD